MGNWNTSSALPVIFSLNQSLTKLVIHKLFMIDPSALLSWGLFHCNFYVKRVQAQYTYPPQANIKTSQAHFIKLLPHDVVFAAAAEVRKAAKIISEFSLEMYSQRFWAQSDLCAVHSLTCLFFLKDAHFALWAIDSPDEPSEELSSSGSQALGFIFHPPKLFDFLCCVQFFHRAKNKTKKRVVFVLGYLLSSSSNWSSEQNSAA